MSKLEVEFAFEIGDEVYIKTSSHTYELRPNKYMITSRIAEECPGGVQRHYALGGLDGWVNEILITRDRPAYEEETPERTAERERRRAAEHSRTWGQFAEGLKKIDAGPETEK